MAILSVSKSRRTYSPFRLYPPQKCSPYHYVCFSTHRLTEGKLGKDRWGDTFVPLTSLLLLLWEAVPSRSAGIGKVIFLILCVVLRVITVTKRLD